jgi:prepilin-type N-terminal cleavage/methylation domain-containing protein
MTTPHRQSGFSLIELLLVVAVIGIVSAIAVPNLVSSRRAANEASALATLRIIVSAQYTYSSSTGGGSYGSLADLQTAALVDTVVGVSDVTAKTGYFFTTDSVAGPSFPAFDATAEPAIFAGVTATGSRSFFVNETGVIQSALSATAPTCTADNSRTIAGGTPVN